LNNARDLLLVADKVMAFSFGQSRTGSTLAGIPRAHWAFILSSIHPDDPSRSRSWNGKSAATAYICKSNVAQGRIIPLISAQLPRRFDYASGRDITDEKRSGRTHAAREVSTAVKVLDAIQLTGGDALRL
jgi:hypothetical protein